MFEMQKRLPAIFYQTGSGNEVVWDWLRSLDMEDRRKIGFDLKDVEYGWPVGMPLCRSLGNGLWEARSNISHGRIARLIFCIKDEHIIVLHGFIKKTQKTPKSDLNLAMKRKREIEQW
jgi:phage-related protein